MALALFMYRCRIRWPDDNATAVLGLPLWQQAAELARNYDVIVCHMLFRYHNDWATRLGIPYFVVPHGSLDPYVFSYRRLQKELWMLACGTRFFRAEGVIFATQRESQKVFRGIGSDKAHVINWPVEDGAGKGPKPGRSSRLAGYIERRQDAVCLWTAARQ